MVVASTTITDVAAMPPIATDAPDAKFDPVMVTGTPPTVDAAFGVMLAIRGAVEDGAVEELPHADAATAAATTTPRKTFDLKSAPILTRRAIVPDSTRAEAV